VTGPASIELQNVSMSYRTPGGVVEALRDVSFSVGAGESIAIVGPSGCGKSTLLGLIGALDAPTAGRIALDGQEISAMSEPQRSALRRLNLGFVFQSDNLHPFLTVAENVALQLSLAGLGDGEARCVDLLGALGLGNQLDKLPDQLSGGQRQRVGIARALVHWPRVILADEPTGALDPDTSSSVVDTLLAACRESGATLVLVTHDRRVGERMDRTLALRDGQLIQEIRAHAG
jgi:putative ABC transport system ATP-binding protein